jgi:hypothetical protein
MYSVRMCQRYHAFAVFAELVCCFLLIVTASVLDGKCCIEDVLVETSLLGTVDSCNCEFHNCSGLGKSLLWPLSPGSILTAYHSPW